MDGQNRKPNWEDNKNTWITVGIIVLLLIVGLIIYESNKNGGNGNGQPMPGAVVNPSPSATTTPPATKNPAPKGSSAYDKALQTYTNRFQFNQCRGTNNQAGNGTMVLRLGSKFMLDNRDPQAHTFAFKGQSHRIAGYGYFIATATTLGIYPITCDGGGSVQINVEK